jgi:hypothetical protein
LTRRAILCAPLSFGGDVQWKSDNPLAADPRDANFEVLDYTFHVILEPGQSWISTRYKVNAYSVSGGPNYVKDIPGGCFLFTVELNPKRTIPESNTSNNRKVASYSKDDAAGCQRKALLVPQLASSAEKVQKSLPEQRPKSP